MLRYDLSSYQNARRHCRCQSTTTSLSPTMTVHRHSPRLHRDYTRPMTPVTSPMSHYRRRRVHDKIKYAHRDAKERRHIRVFGGAEMKSMRARDTMRGACACADRTSMRWRVKRARYATIRHVTVVTLDVDAMKCARRAF